MAICRMCHKTIPDGMDFCEDCESKRMNKADESYLDSLLSSVSADLDSSAQSVYENVAKRVSNFPSSVAKGSAKAKKDAGSGEMVIDAATLEAADTFLGEIISEDSVAEDSVAEDVVAEDAVTEDALFTADTDMIEPAEDSDEIAVIDPLDNSDDIVVTDSDDISDDIASIDPAGISDDISSIDPADSSDDVMVIDPADTTDSLGSIDSMDSTDSTESTDYADSLDSIDASDSADLADSGDVDELLDSLLADLDEAGIPETAPEPSDVGPDDISDIFAAAESDDVDAVSAEEALFTVSDDVYDDLQNAAGEGIDDLQNEIIDGADSELVDNPIGEIEEIDFSTADIDSHRLGDTSASPELEMADIPGFGSDDTITSAEKQFLSEEDLENSLNGTAPDGMFSIEDIVAEIESGDIDKTIKALDGDAPDSQKRKKSKGPKEKKPSLFTRLFANIQLTPQEIKAQEAKEKAAEEQKKQALEKKARKKEQSKEEKEEKKAKSKIEKEEQARKKAEEKKKKQEEAKEKARKKKEEKLALAEFEVDEGRINKVGATILFVIFAIITVFIIVGTNIYSYNLSIKNAENEFEIRHYNDAYYEVYGLKIQDEDIDLYDKIMTVMYVNTQLNSYEYYMTSNNREKALDSLLKGLQRYDKYHELATILDITDDLNYVKSIILEHLADEFGLTESEAYDMIEIRDEVDYSEFLYSLLGTYEVDLSE